jgi:hypothetical protein
VVYQRLLRSDFSELWLVRVMFKWMVYV